MAHPMTVERLDLGDHVCWMFDDDDARLDAMARFVSAGLGYGDRVRFDTTSLSPDALLEALGARGVDVDEPVRTGQLKAYDTGETYLAGGEFDPHRVIRCLSDEMARTTANGYRGLRVVGDMAWAHDPTVEVDALSWYEGQINTLFADGGAIGLCQYDRRLFDGADLRRVGTAHPGTTWSDDGPEWTPRLRMRRTVHPPRLHLIGEVDLSNFPALATVLEAMVTHLPGAAPPASGAALPTPDGERPPPLVIDATRLAFADVATVSQLLVTARSAPGGMEIRGCTPVVARTLEAIGASRPAGVTLVVER